MDILANDPGLRLNALVALFATLAGIRLMVTGLRQPTGRWSLLVGGILLAFSLARTLPRLL